MSMIVLLDRPCATVGDHLQFHMPVEVEPIDRNGVSVEIDDDAQVTVDAFRVDEGWMLNVRGTLTVRLRCDRCLEPATLPLSLSFQAEAAEDAASVEEDDLLLPMNRDTVDISERVREHIILALPLKVLCRPDCQGLCPQCGQDLNQGSCDCDTTDLDPRLEGLAELKAQLIETEKD